MLFNSSLFRQLSTSNSDNCKNHWFVLPAELLFTDLRVNCTVDVNEYVSEARVDSWKGDACTLLPFVIAVGVPQFSPLN